MMKSPHAHKKSRKRASRHETCFDYTKISPASQPWKMHEREMRQSHKLSKNRISQGYRMFDVHAEYKTGSYSQLEYEIPGLSYPMVLKVPHH
jgi:hypothetical protein